MGSSTAASPRVCTGRRAPCMDSAENQSHRDRGGSLHGARRNANRRTSGATHAARAYCSPLPQAQLLQDAGLWPFTVLPWAIAARTTFQAPCHSPGVYSNLEPIGTCASTRRPCPSHRVPGRFPRPSRGTTFEGGLDGGDGVCVCVYYCRT
jgi:hypothetical protein